MTSASLGAFNSSLSRVCLSIRRRRRGRMPRRRGRGHVTFVVIAMPLSIVQSDTPHQPTLARAGDESGNTAYQQYRVQDRASRQCLQILPFYAFSDTRRPPPRHFCLRFVSPGAYRYHSNGEYTCGAATATPARHIDGSKRFFITAEGLTAVEGLCRARVYGR